MNNALFSKYNNKKTIIDGITFSSKRESKRYCELKLLQSGKEIKDLTLQVPHILQIAFTDFEGVKHRAITYISDFEYFDNKLKSLVVEDVKGMKTEVYKIKKKLFLYAYQDLIFREIT